MLQNRLINCEVRVHTYMCVQFQGNNPDQIRSKKFEVLIIVKFTYCYFSTEKRTKSSEIPRFSRYHRCLRAFFSLLSIIKEIKNADKNDATCRVNFLTI